jgi:uncharacterized protein with HEPN domain
MLPESSKLLLDIRQALEDIEVFTAGLNLEAYKTDAKCRAAVERKFEVAGEACVRLRDRFPEIFESLHDAPRLIGFRNRIIHGYDDVDDTIVWEVATTKLQSLRKQVSALLG